MFFCPNCARALTRMQSTAGIYWVCESCGGRTVAVPILRKAVGEKRITELWANARSAPIGGKRCPTCSHRMCEATADGLRLDVCKVCQFVWFDAREFEQMPSVPIVSQRAELPPTAREALALYEVEQLRERADSEGPVSDWQHVPAFFGLPVECDSPGLTGYPAVTWSISFVVLIASVAAFMLGDSFVEEFALVPAEAWRYGGLTLVTSFFLHGGILHLASNLYFFLVFGDNVEDYLGRWRFAVLLLAATIVGDLSHVLGDPRAELPCVGASGGISGIITFYALKFPHAKLGLYLRASYRLRWVQFPAWGGLAIWIALQFIGVVKQLSGFTHVSALAHIGGAAMGLLAWLLWGLKDGKAMIPASITQS